MTYTMRGLSVHSSRCASNFIFLRIFFSRYLQIRDFVCKMFPQFPDPPPYDHLLKDPPRWKGIISTIYSKISTPLCTSFSQIKVLWEDDLEMVIPDED